MENKWFYIKSEPTLYTVGYEDSAGKWHTDSDWDTKKEAGERVHFLNGGADKELLEALESLINSPESYVLQQRLLDRAEAAIKKAKGE